MKLENLKNCRKNCKDLKPICVSWEPKEITYSKPKIGRPQNELPEIEDISKPKGRQILLKI